jgi:hypothetical protein
MPEVLVSRARWLAKSRSQRPREKKTLGLRSRRSDSDSPGDSFGLELGILGEKAQDLNEGEKE